MIGVKSQFRSKLRMADNSDFVPGQRIRLRTLINERVRFKVHELTDTKEGVIRAIDQQGYWIEGGSLAEYLQGTSPGTDGLSEIQFIGFKRIHWIQNA